jgi:CBS domain-containing protein
MASSSSQAVTLAKCLRNDKVSALRLRDVCRVSPRDSIEKVVRTMVGCRAGFALVMEGGDPSGKRGAGTAPGAAPGTDGGHPPGAAGTPGAAGIGRMIGIFTERDFVNRVVAAGLDTSQPVQSVMSPAPTAVRRSASVQSAVELMASGGYRHLPVLGDGGEPLGVLSVKDVVRYLVEYFPAKVYNLPPTPEHTQPAREGA